MRMGYLSTSPEPIDQAGQARSKELVSTMEQLFRSEGNEGETLSTFGHSDGTAYFWAGGVFQSYVGGSSA